MPALRGGMMKGAGSGWRIAVMRPGGDPIGNLAAELAKKDVLSEAGTGLPSREAEAVIEATLRSGSLGILNVARQARLGEHEKLLIVVDQFEELFRFRAAHEGSSVDEASAFRKTAARSVATTRAVDLHRADDAFGLSRRLRAVPGTARSDQRRAVPDSANDARRAALRGHRPVGVTRGKISSR